MSMSMWWRYPFFLRSRFFSPSNHGLMNPEKFFAPFFSEKELQNFWKQPDEFMKRQFYREDLAAVTFHKDQFLANLDVQNFKPEEIVVKVAGDNIVVVEGKHEEKETEAGSISRHFIRKFVLPEGHDMEKLESKLSSDGILTITAPKIGEIEEEERGFRTIPITRTDAPATIASANENKDEEKK